MIDEYNVSIRLLLLISFFSILSGCGAKDTAEPPAELVRFTPEVKVEKRWKVDVGRGTGDYSLTLKPYVTADTIYVVDFKGKLVAINKENGKKRWAVKTNLLISGGLGGNQSLLFLGTRNGELFAFDQKDGQQIWQIDLSSEMLSSPAANEDTLVIHTIDGNLSALRTTDGSQKWSDKHDVPALSLRGNSSPRISANIVVYGTDNGRLIARTLSDGKILWEVPVSVSLGRNELEKLNDVDMMPLIDQGVIYAGAFQGRIAAVSLTRGQILWPRDKSTYLTLGLDESNLYATDEVSHITAFDRNTGATLWSQDKLHVRSLTTAVPYKDYVVSGDFEGYLHVLGKYDGRFVSRIRLDKSGIATDPVVDGDFIYVLGRSGELFALKI